VPQYTGRVARRAVQLVDPRLTSRVLPAAWLRASGKPRSVTRPSSRARSARVWGNSRLCNAGSPASSASVRTRRHGMASRCGPTAPMRAALPSGSAGQALPAWAQECSVGHPGSCGRQQPTRSQAAGRSPPCRVGLPMAVVLHHALPGSQGLRGAPAPIRTCGPDPPHGRRVRNRRVRG
jgi:hypothetical protein